MEYGFSSYRVDRSKFNLEESQSDVSNFAMIIPADIARKDDGTPYLAISIEDKERFIDWAELNNIDLEPMTVTEREELFIKHKKEFTDECH